MHSFHAFIDEAGDEGFKFKDFPERASSEWFVMSACVFKGSDQTSASNALKATLDPIEGARKSKIHFRGLPHETRVAVIHKLSELPIWVMWICFNKRRLEDHTLGNSRRLYFYATRFLVERISWLTRDVKADGNGKCKLNFSHSKNLSYEELFSYFALLKSQDTEIKWDFVDTENVSVKHHDSSIWLRAADATATGVYRGLELNEYGLCEDRYATMLKPVVYYRGKYFGYGLKMFPSVPEVEKERANRYGWLDLFK